MKRTPLRPKKIYTLKRTPLKAGLGYKGLKRTPLKKQSDKAKELWEKVREEALARDDGKCIICKAPATDVHHIHLRSKRPDLKYKLCNLVSLCKRHHFHQGSEKYQEQCEIIANKKGITVEELMKQAEGE